MKKALLFLCCLITSLVAFGQEPTPPTLRWCKWAFQQIPDHMNISAVDAEAFSNDFRTLLKVAFDIEDWEREKYPGELGGWEFLAYWYAGNGDSPLDDPNHTIEYRIGRVRDGRTSVYISIHTPGWLPYGPEYHLFTMNLVYENDAWRIDDWLNKDYEGRGFNPSMRKELKDYIRSFEKEIP